MNRSNNVNQRLESAFQAVDIKRPMRVLRYEPGTMLSYDIHPVYPTSTVPVKLRIEKFAGGGFAGQVYKVNLVSIDPCREPLNYANTTGLQAGCEYAMKIMIPPSRFSLFFRNMLYSIGFQSQFQIQINPAAVRAGALWQKFIRAAAQCEFNDPLAVNDVHATFVDSTLGGCGELSNWVDGRTWQLEVDDRMDLLKEWRRGKIKEHPDLGSPEYREKYSFMKKFTRLLHEMGAPEFARQYEWTTCKSQPNCLKRFEKPEGAGGGLTAVDFRAGLALLPFLPMSPGDFKLIAGGIRRGSLVQFDRGNIPQLEQYIESNPQVKDILPDSANMLGELKDCEESYRDSQLDITHNFPRLFYDRKLWRSLFAGSARGWRVRNIVNREKEKVLAECPLKTLLFFLVGLLPIIGGVLRKCWGRPEWRAHYLSIFSEKGYFLRALRGRICENLIAWHRSGRISAEKTISLQNHLIRNFFHHLLSFLPVSLHRFLTDKKFFKDKLYNLFVRPIKLYFHPQMRTQWLRDMVAKGQEKEILSKQDADLILARIDEPFIQKYLVSLVVHVMTLPVTQVVSLIAAGYFYWSHPELSQAERTAAAAGIVALFQVIPLSPGSLCRGFYTTGMAVKDRNFKEYNIALFLSYFKYVGYLAFPIQMAYRYPVLARFMAAHWATDAVRMVPVFGERGALLEHAVFCLFYNWPLTLRRRMARISEMRRKLPSRYWHLPVILIITATLFVLLHRSYWILSETPPEAANLWYVRPLLPAIFIIPLLAGRFSTLYAGGMQRGKRIISAALIGLTSALLYSGSLSAFETNIGGEAALLAPIVWRCFAFTIFSAFGAILGELQTKDV